MTYYGYDEMNQLSRSNWTGTWPERISIEANEALLIDINPYQSYKGTENSTAEMPTMGADNGMTLGMMIGKAYDGPRLGEAAGPGHLCGDGRAGGQGLPQYGDDAERVQARHRR